MPAPSPPRARGVTARPGADATVGDSVARRSAAGGAILLAAHLLQLIAAVAATAVVARLLAPADFGLFAMALVPLALAVPVRDFGLPFAIAHEERTSAARLDRLFRVNLALSAGLAAAMAASALPLALFFGEPAVIVPVLWMAAATLVRGSANVHTGLLQRRMAYARLAAFDTVAVLVGALAAVLLALRGHTVGALLAQQVLVLCVQAVLLWSFAGWRPRSGGGPRDEEDSPDALLAYGRSLSLSRLLVECAAQSDRIIVGRVDGTAALGLYQSALRWVSLPLLQVFEPLRVVAVGGFARLRAEPERYRRFAANAFELGLSLLLPLFVALALLADLLIGVLLGPQWAAAVPLFRVLSVAMLFEGVAMMAGWVFLGEGRTRAQLRFDAIAMPLLVLCLLLGSVGGAMGVALALAAARLALLPPLVAYCLRGSPLRAGELPRLLPRPSAATLAAAAVVTALRRAGVGAEGGPLALLLLAGAFAATFLPCWALAPGGAVRLRELRELLRGRGARGTRPLP